MEQQLTQLGLSPKAARTYLALLELGPSSILAIARKAGLNRTTLYDIIPVLITEGLISRVINSKTEKYEAESPTRLPLLLERKIQELQLQMGTAKDLATKLGYLAFTGKESKPKVTLYEGEEGIKKMYEDSLLCKTYIRSFLAPEELKSFDDEFADSYFERRRKKNIRIQGIINDSPESRNYIEHEKELLRDIHLVPTNAMNIKPEVYIYDNKVAFYSLKEKYGVLIESADIAEAIAKLYDLAWAESERSDKELRIQKAPNSKS
ncbi:MAG TPA: helix-turn-helix domain-containing protein [Patescibacteria group bacterium]